MAWNNDSIIRLATVDSTNRYMRDNASELWSKHGESGFVVVTAGHQTAGRGQRGNTWNSNAGENLLFSILARPGESLKVTEQFLLSQAVALSLHEAMLHFGIETRLKWPNDIYVGKRKLAGILLELDYAGAFVEQAIIGIGVNVNQEYFPTMDRIPVSMKILQGDEFILDDVLATILDSFERYYHELESGSKELIAEKYTRLLLGVNEQRNFVYKDGCFEGTITGVERDGHLIIERNDGNTCRYAFKEVEIVL
ncbi:MAG: biotin--[Bacteroidaceae bacterium]|nr:biotin--[acetyl-CoA-carboxylase] ligase [Bacteroidaceae bacterium]